MRIPIFQLDAFASRVFSGNPAAVCPLPGWLDDATMLAIAAENALSETAFVVRDAAGWAIRWFTPTLEVDLCGHATLAAGHVVLTALDPAASEVRFRSRSGVLAVRRDGERLALDFPSRPAAPVEPPPALPRALRGATLDACLAARDVIAVLGSEDEVAALSPDLAAVRELDAQGLIVTARGRSCDFVSRYFAPRAGIDEDPVTGSAHCTLAPLWASRLGKTVFEARQVSRRGGELHVELRGDRVIIAGRVAPYLEGHIEVPGSPAPAA
jgi:predicted PhzF superfamily epimerase YddE/YHI9